MRFSTVLVIFFAARTLIHKGVARSIQFSAATDVHGSVNITFGFGNRLEQAEAYRVTIRKDFERDPLLQCHWSIIDFPTGQDNNNPSCQAKEGYTSPGIQGHRLTLTIPKASWKDSGHYIFCMDIDFQGEHTCETDIVVVVEANEDVPGSANITFDLGSRLEQAVAYRPTLTIRKDSKLEHLLLCHWGITDDTGQENPCKAKEGYTSSGIQDHRLTLTILKPSPQNSGRYTFCMHTDFEEVCKTYTVKVVEVNKVSDTASYITNLTCSAIATAEPNMVVIITIIAVVVLTGVLVH